MKFINPKRENYHHKAIRKFSEDSTSLANGVVKGYNSVEYSWIADFLFKNTGNRSINPHVGYIDFVGDRDLTYQEYGNVSEIYDTYNFFSEWTRDILSKNSYEMSTKQYSKVGQRYSEFDLIQYINASESLTINESIPEPSTINHQFYRAPVYAASGYLLNHIDLGLNIKQYMFVRDSEVSTGGSYYDNIGSELFEKEFSFALKPKQGDLSGNLAAPTIIGFADNQKTRLYDYKLDIDNRFTFFEPKLREWIMYYNDTNHYEGRAYYPYYGEVLFFSVPSVNNSQGKYLQNYIESFSGTNVYFFPEVIQRGVLEPAKVIADWGSSEEAKNESNGAMAYNPSNHLGQPNDQSRIVYNICRRQIKNDSFGVFSVNSTYSGIDIDTERNRRYSAVVMTEPYMTVTPIGGGEVVEYSFVDKDGNNVKFTDDNDFASRPDMFLKIKAPLHIFTAIEELLSEREENTDIINVLSIKSPVTNISAFDPGTTPYNKLGDNANNFFSRQDDCLDDLIEGEVGVGKHNTFYSDHTIPDSSKYSAGKIKINGAGFVSKTIVNSSGVIIGTENEFNMYCSNYEAINCPLQNQTDPVIANSETKLIFDNSKITKVSGREVFKPMIKLSGMNGYIKIINRNLHFKTSRASDGNFEIIFNVEFPYCPGSYSSRMEMDFTENNFHGFIYKKIAYINAGSHEAYGDYYDSYNDRYVPFRDDSFTKHAFLVQHSVSEILTTDPSTRGGGFVNPLSVDNKRIKYPSDVIWKRLSDWRLLSIKKSTLKKFERYGTYDIKLQEESVENDFSRDVKLLCLADNRQWKFDQDRYSSFIGRENPSMVCQIDIATLYKDFTAYQKDHGSIPDTKRWISAYFSGFAHIMLEDIDEDRQSEKTTTMGSVKDLTTQSSKSDLIIEIWDSKSDVGNGKQGNWRPFLYNGFDYKKIPGKLIVDNIYISEEGIGDPDIDLIPGPGFITSAYIGYSEGQFLDFFPENVNHTKFDGPTENPNDILDGKSNLILYDKESGKVFHIAYIESIYPNDDPDIGLNRELYKIYFRYNLSEDGPLKTVTQPQDPGWTAPYQILDPRRMMSKDTRFSFDSIKATEGAPDGLLTRFIDLRDDISSPSDMDRYSIDEKIFFRIRTAKNKEFPTSYSNEDESELTFIDDKDYASGKVYLNNPWADPNTGDFDLAFDWSKIQISEGVRKLGLSHFRSQSK